MHKIKKGIKKKIKGKKGKHDDEIFTEEELEQYKREKAEEAQRLAEEQQQNQLDHPLDETLEPDNSHEFNEACGGVEEEETSPTNNTCDNSDWKSFLASTDTVLKKTSDNLEHIKESSYFQLRKTEKDDLHPGIDLVDPSSERRSACASPVKAVLSKNWVDLEKGGIDDESEEYQSTEVREETQVESPPKKKFVELKPIEDLPELSAEDYADVFDTAYVDDIESGELKLIVPDSPTEDYSNEPDPFDTSAADRVLHTEEPEPEPEPEPDRKLASKPGNKISNSGPPQKRKFKLVSLGNAVDVLTGKAPPVKPKVEETSQLNLLGEFTDESIEDKKVDTKDKKVDNEDINNKEIVPSSSEEARTDIENNEHGTNIDEQNKEKDECEIDDILFAVDESLDDLPQLGVPIITTTECPKNQEEKSDLSEFDDLLNTNTENEYQSDEKSFDLKELVSEFDDIDKVVSDGVDDKLIEDPILDEFDAEFASLAHESVAKAKDKEIDEIGIDGDDDPFDTSHVCGIVSIDTEIVDNCDPFDTKICDDTLNKLSKDNKVSTSPLLPQTESPCASNRDLPSNDPLSTDLDDPFDTSIAQKILPVDHFETTENDADLASTLEPAFPTKGLSRSESFDPFDTSAADAFGLTELKVLENELLKQAPKLKSPEDDFDFNPREDEESEDIENTLPTVCLLSSETEETGISVLPPQERLEEEEFDPFDTSIADKIQIKSLEEELLDKPAGIDNVLPDTYTPIIIKQPPPRPVSPACLLASSPTSEDINPALEPVSSTVEDTVEDEIDPFDTSIADAYGITELKVLESEFLNNNESLLPKVNVREVLEQASEIKDTQQNLELKIKPQRPPSPACLLGATPLDENPTLIPVTEQSEINCETDFDPFDTSIAQQFGKAELQVLESEFLKRDLSPVPSLEDFDPRAAGSIPAKSHPARPPIPSKPFCLLSEETKSPLPVELPIVPSEPLSQVGAVDELDPFDTSIADKFGVTELKHLENELLSDIVNETTNESSDVDEFSANINSQLSPNPNSSPNSSNKCLLATTPTDCCQPLQPFTQNCTPIEGSEALDFDPFDTSIANQFGKTEIKELEQSLLSSTDYPIKPKFNIPEAVIAAQSIDSNVDPFDTSIAEPVICSGFKRSLSEEDFDPREEEVKRSTGPVDLLDSTEYSVLPDTPIEILKPQGTLPASAHEEIEEIDPFDTSIAANIVPGKTELKILESELLKN